jgi:hypothetical protein
MKPLPPVTRRTFGSQNPPLLALLYLPYKRPILHPGRGLGLLGTKVLK